MKKESRILIYSMVNNGVIAFLKIWGGLFFKLESLLADGLHTISDLVTDIFCIIGLKLSKKRPTKYHPFGFGKLEYLTNLFIGIILLLLGIFIVVNSFNTKKTIPSLSLLWVVLVTIILKYIAIYIMAKEGRKTNSQALLTSAKESKMDLYSSIGVMIITILLQFEKQIPILKYSDMIGTIIIGVLVLKMAFVVIKSNSLALIGEVDENKDILNNIESIVLTNPNIEKCLSKLIKYGSYYALDLTLVINKNLSFKQVVKIEKEVKRNLLRKKSLHIKNIMIYVTDEVEY